MLVDTDVKAKTQARMPSILVEDMQDGGMGGIHFLATGCTERHYAKTLAQARYLDDDGVVVSIVITVDQNGELYEVDFWKVDFSPLKRYPEASEVTLEAVQ